MTVKNPYIKKPENKQWLQDNWETFIEYMARNHSLVDCWHTVLDISTFNDAYIEGMISKVEAADKKKEKEEKIRKAKKSGKKVSEVKEASATEKKMAKMEEAAEKIEKQWDDYSELP